MKAELKRIVKFVAPYGIISKHNLALESRQEVAYLSNIENTPEPEIYNKYGERMRVFYIQDTLGRFMTSFCIGRQSRYIYWDRANKKLENHFYSHEQILKTSGTPRKKYAILIESDQIVPQDYLIFDRNPGLNKEFDKIFTFSERLLDKYENALLYIYGTVWYGTPKGGGEMRENLFEEKTANVSMLCSNKEYTELHKLRKEIAIYLRNNHLADTFGNFDGGPRLSQVAEALTKYRFNVAIENSLTRNYFTEKIMNCFASMTIPIYIGADNVGSFFNEDGIIKLTPNTTMLELERVIKSCTKEYYSERISAVKDNYSRVQDYLCPEDYIYSRYSHIFG